MESKPYPPRTLSAAGLAAGLLLLTSATFAAEKAAPTVDADHVKRVTEGTRLFKSHVRALLTKHCLECHGGKSTKADFDLSNRKALMAGGMVEKSAADSYLMTLIAHEEDPHMPFKAEKLPAEAIARIGKWIDLGAPYDKPLTSKAASETEELVVTPRDRQFWSFRPLAGVSVPNVDGSWPRTPIDAFVLARLQKQNLHPNGPASRRTLIRRATYDLLGLPPTPQEVEEFVSDSDPAAYSKLIDRLLDSPHYGERWARHWMDVARFAESHGYEQDYDRPHAYHYRDFLIKAFNDDMPYDQFVRWQLAGDELAPDNPLALMATGFLGGGAFPTQLTEAEFESARYDELDDIVATLGVSFLGLSVGCARCHDHKYDPIPTRDYYRLAANFTTTIRSEIDLDLDPSANERRRAEFTEKLDALRRRLADYEKNELPAAFDDWLKTTDLDSLSPWRPLASQSVASSAQSKFVRQDDGSWLAAGKTPDKDVLTIKGVVGPGAVGSLRLEALTHKSLPKSGPGRASNGNFALGDVKVSLGSERGEAVTLTAARTTHEQNDGQLSVAASIDADPVSGWAVDGGGVGGNQAAVFDFGETITLEHQTPITVTLTFQHPNKKHSIGRFRLSVADNPGLEAQAGSVGPSQTVRDALKALRSTRDQNSAAWKKALGWFAATQPKRQALKQQIAELEKRGPQVELTKVQVCSEGLPPTKHHADGRGFPHFYKQTYFLKRGDVHQKQNVAKAGFLQVLQPGDKDEDLWSRTPPTDWRTSYRRTSLADWITDTRQGAGHLAARVIVNRLWQHHFGTGIVATPNDFGMQGERPTHPELLDWLARDLIDNGWRLKRLHKLIMTSSVYMQSTDYDQQRSAVDPENRLLWRRAPRRLEAEAIRDAMLSVSGMLDRTMFGPGTLDQGMKRRSVYFFIKRSQLIPMMMLFDWPEHLVSIGNRSTTTIAPQALMFMNSPQGRQYAVALARRIVADDVESAITEIYRLCYSRPPTSQETEMLRAFLDKQTKMYSDSNAAHPRQTALADLCQTVMSANEFVYVE